MTPFFVLRVVLIGLLLFAVPGISYADDASEAKTLFDKGNRDFVRAMRSRGERKRELLASALVSYVESLRFARHRNVVFNTAVVLTELDRNPEAHAYLVEYLEFEDLADAERRD